MEVAVDDFEQNHFKHGSGDDLGLVMAMVVVFMWLWSKRHRLEYDDERYLWD
jgi:hypothetical protein